MQKTILLLGPRFNKKNPHIIGGPIVLFEDLLSQLNKNKILYQVIDTNKNNYANSLLAYLSILSQLLFKLKNTYHISLHSSQDYMILGLPIILFSKIFKKRTSLRKFGGEAESTFQNASYIKKYLLNIIFSQMDNLFLETKYLVTFFLKLNKNTFWFPNVRSRTVEPKLPRTFQKKFVFISHVIKEKGIDEIIEASRELDSTYTIDIYGPLLEKHYTKEVFHKEKVSYKGVLPADKVLHTLNKYDVVLLPSYKEGYPGIIIEAYSLGIPVIASNLKGISEIVQFEKTGILIESKNAKELISAIKFFNRKKYMDMSTSAYLAFDTFDSDLNTKKYLDILDHSEG